MILAENYIELNIYHFNKLKRYDVYEIFRDDEGISFKIYCDGDYVFTLIPKMMEWLTFEPSEFDIEMNVAIDRKLSVEIEAALYSVFLKELPS